MNKHYTADENFSAVFFFTRVLGGALTSLHCFYDGGV